MTTDVDPALAAPAPASRAELVAMVSKAHQASSYADSSVAGKALAAQSRLPKLVAENLGAGFGQWDFFPEIGDIVDFALAYAPPSTEEEVWALARSWAADDAAGRRTVLVLVGKEILQHELRRVEVPKLRELFDEARPARALALRASLGLEMPPAAPPRAAKKRAPATPASPAASPDSAAGAPGPAPPRVPPAPDVPARMPKPAIVKPPKAPPPAPPKRFRHPKFGDATLVTADGAGPDAKLTLKFEVGTKILLARYVVELPSEEG